MIGTLFALCIILVIIVSFFCSKAEGTEEPAATDTMTNMMTTKTDWKNRKSGKQTTKKSE